MESGTINNLLASWETSLSDSDTVYMMLYSETTNHADYKSPAEFNPSEYGVQYFVYSILNTVDLNDLEASIRSPSHSIGLDLLIDVDASV